MTLNYEKSFKVSGKFDMSKLDIFWKKSKKGGSQSYLFTMIRNSNVGLFYDEE